MHVYFSSPGWQSQSVPVNPGQSRSVPVSPGESYWMQILGDSRNSTRNGIIWPGFLWDSSRNFSWIYSHLMDNGWGTIPGGILVFLPGRPGFLWDSSRNTWGSVKSSQEWQMCSCTQRKWRQMAVVAAKRWESARVNHEQRAGTVKTVIIVLANQMSHCLHCDPCK